MDPKDIGIVGSSQIYGISAKSVSMKNNVKSTLGSICGSVITLFGIYSIIVSMINIFVSVVIALIGLFLVSVCSESD